MIVSVLLHGMNLRCLRDVPWELCSWGGSLVVSGLPTTPKVVVMILGRWRIQHVNIHAFDVGPMGLVFVQPWELCS